MVTRFLTSVFEWLREGYPAGIPPQDTIPVLALLRRRLTDAEVAEIAGELSSRGLLEPDLADIGAHITKVTDALPHQDDLRRVANHLAFRRFPNPDADDSFD